MDLIPLPFEERVSLDGEKKAKIERQLHEGVQLQIEKTNKLYSSKANKENMIGSNLLLFRSLDVHHGNYNPYHKVKSNIQEDSDGPMTRAKAKQLQRALPS